jgi:hypothetical protein
LLIKEFKKQVGETGGFSWEIFWGTSNNGKDMGRQL